MSRIPASNDRTSMEFVISTTGLTGLRTKKATVTAG